MGVGGVGGGDGDGDGGGGGEMPLFDLEHTYSSLNIGGGRREGLLGDGGDGDDDDRYGNRGGVGGVVGEECACE